MLRAAIPAATVVLLLASCGLGGSSFCDFRDGSANGAEPRCQERVDTLSSGAFKGACSAVQGKASDGRCPREGVVGGCELGTQGDGSKVNDWYYSPKTREEVQAECTKDGTKFLEP